MKTNVDFFSAQLSERAISGPTVKSYSNSSHSITRLHLYTFRFRAHYFNNFKIFWMFSHVLVLNSIAKSLQILLFMWMETYTYEDWVKLTGICKFAVLFPYKFRNFRWKYWKVNNNRTSEVFLCCVDVWKVWYSLKIPKLSRTKLKNQTLPQFFFGQILEIFFIKTLSKPMPRKQCEHFLIYI